MNGKALSPRIYVCDVEDQYLKDDFNFEIAMRLLPYNVQTQVLRRTNDKLKRITLVNRLLQLHGCGVATQSKPSEIIFDLNRFGKPFLRDFEGVQFSMSNGEQSCVMAVQTEKIGIDIASTRNCAQWEPGYVTMFQDIFSEQEFETLKNAHSSQMQDDLFTFYWSLKESYMKLTGTGLNTNIPKIDLKDLSTLARGETRTLHRVIDDRSVIFTSRWINDHEIVSTSSYETAEDVVAYEIVKVSVLEIANNLK